MADQQLVHRVRCGIGEGRAAGRGNDGNVLKRQQAVKRLAPGGIAGLRCAIITAADGNGTIRCAAQQSCAQLEGIHAGACRDHQRRGQRFGGRGWCLAE